MRRNRASAPLDRINLKEWDDERGALTEPLLGLSCLISERLLNLAWSPAGHNSHQVHKSQKIWKTDTTQGRLLLMAGYWLEQELQCLAKTSVKNIAVSRVGGWT